MIILSGCGFNYYILLEQLKQLNAIYTETFTLDALLQSISQSPSSYDLILFDANLMTFDALGPHVRAIHPSIPIVCLSGQGGMSRMALGSNDVLPNPPTRMSCLLLFANPFL